jgi:glycosyltransferase involved in cell wall biosynthesis
LKEFIPKLLSQKHKNFELIIVDDRSTDGSLDYLRELSKLDQKLKHIRIDQTPEGMSAKKYALTLGIKAAKYETIIFTDADCVPESPDWLNAVLNGYDDKNIKLVLGYSKYEKRIGFLNKFIRFETSVTALHYLSFAFKKIPYMGVGRNLSYTKTLFLDNNGFQPYMSFLSGDDDLFVQKVATGSNTNIVTSNASHTLSKPKETLNEYVIQKVRHLNVGKYYKAKHKSVLGLLFLSLLIFYICLVPALKNLDILQLVFLFLG